MGAGGGCGTCPEGGVSRHGVQGVGEGLEHKGGMEDPEGPVGGAPWDGALTQ